MKCKVEISGITLALHGTGFAFILLSLAALLHLSSTIALLHCFLNHFLLQISIKWACMINIKQFSACIKRCQENIRIVVQKLNVLRTMYMQVLFTQNITTWPLAGLHAYKFPLLSMASPHSLIQFFNFSFPRCTWKYRTNFPLLVNINILWRSCSLIYT